MHNCTHSLWFYEAGTLNTQTLLPLSLHVFPIKGEESKSHMLVAPVIDETGKGIINTKTGQFLWFQ